MNSAKITGLTRSNINALREACDYPAVTDGSGFGLHFTATTVTFLCGESEVAASVAITWLDDVMAQMPTRGHPRASLHAVRRKLAALVPADQPLKTLPGRAHAIDSEGRTRDPYSGEEVEL